MAKVRLTVTYVYEYEIKPEHYESYGDCKTDEQRMNVDLEQYREEPTHLDFMDAKSIDINGELVE